MAYIVDAARGPVTSPLAKVRGLTGLQQQSDMLRLGRMGDRRCQEIWNGFAEQDPAMARLVIKSVDADDRGAAKASRQVGKVLARAEPMVTKQYKPPKPKKARKAARRAAEAVMLHKAAGSPPYPVRTLEEAVLASVREYLREGLYCDDPDRREKAWDMRFRGLI